MGPVLRDQARRLLPLRPRLDFANCSSWNVPAAQRGLCFHGPPGQRHNPNFYVWHEWSGAAYHRHPFGLDSELRSFSVAAIEHEPGAHAATTLGDLEHYASFGHWTNRFDTPFTHWRFPTTMNGPHLASTERSIARHGGTLALDRSLVGPLRDYQRVIFLPGPVMAAILLASVAAAVIGRRPPARRRRGEAMLAAGDPAAVRRGRHRGPGGGRPAGRADGGATAGRGARARRADDRWHRRLT